MVKDITIVDNCQDPLDIMREGGLDIEVYYKGEHYLATLKTDGTVDWMDNIYTSLSAAGQAVKASTGLV